MFDRELSSQSALPHWGIASSFARNLILAIALTFGLLAPPVAQAGVPVTLYRSLAGNLDFVGTAGSLRVGNCGTTPSGSGNLSGIPAGASVRAAYLYWAGSGTTIDTTVTLATPAQSGISVSADRTFTESYVSGGNTYDFFSGFADVTANVAAGGNGTYALSNLAFNTGTPHSNISVCLGGWSLVVVYEDAGEPLRVVNVFDGFQQFRGSQITLTPNNFVVPTSPVNGRLGHITWEGDAGNSGTLNGFQEQLRFEGTVLSDVDNPSNNQFNSTSNATTPTSTPAGVDFDTYALAPPLLAAGQTTGQSIYSSGADRVLLSAEVFAVTNTPVADLSIVKSGPASVEIGDTASFTLTVSNAGPSDETGTITITDPLPSGTTFSSANGTGWSCAESAGTVTCTRSGGLVAGSSLPPISIDALVGPAAHPSISNTATVAGTLFDNVSGNNQSTLVTAVPVADLSTSTKTVVDLNGGDADPGDVLRYTVRLIESSGREAQNVRVTDDIPANVNAFSVSSVPGGSSDFSSGAGTGANNTGLLDIQGITVPASGFVEVVFEVTIAAGTPVGTVISNTATITPTAGSVTSPVAPDVIVSASQQPTSGTKQLYFGDPNAGSGSTRALSRVPPNGLPPTATLGSVTIAQGTNQTWTLAQPLVAPVSLSGANFPVELWLTETGQGSFRTVRVDVATTSLGTIASTSQNVFPNGTPQLFSFTMNPGANLPATIPAGDVVTVQIFNTTGFGSGRSIRVHPAVGASGNSLVALDAQTVINVDSVEPYDAAYPAGAIPAEFAPGSDVYLRVVVSDPFGAFDIADAQLELRDPLGALVFGPSSMAEVVAAQTPATKTFETQYSIPTNAAFGNWTVNVNAIEGLEGAVIDPGVGVFGVGAQPDLVVFKTVRVLDDPVNGTANPKAIPGASVLYTIGVTNQGAGATDSESVLINDPLPTEVDLFVGDLVTPGPIYFVDGSTPSGVTVDFTSLADDVDDIEFDDGSDAWILDPTPDANGFDSSVRAIRIRPTGTLQGSSGSPPSFEVRFRVRIK